MTKQGERSALGCAAKHQLSLILSAEKWERRCNETEAPSDAQPLICSRGAGERVRDRDRERECVNTHCVKSLPTPATRAKWDTDISISR